MQQPLEGGGIMFFKFHKQKKAASIIIKTASLRNLLLRNLISFL